MKLTRLFSVAWHNVRRNKEKTLLSVFGIAPGIGSFVFFMGLSAGVKKVVLGKMFPVDRIEVEAPRTSFLGMTSKEPLNDTTVDKLRAHPMIDDAIPRMEIAFPSMGEVSFRGQSFGFELIGDGIPGSSIESRFADLFRDWEEKDKQEGELCTSAKPVCGEGKYCDILLNRCAHNVPMVVSPRLVEIYNSQLADSRGMPRIGKMEQRIAEKGILQSLPITLHLGRSMVSMTGKRIRRRPASVGAVLVGVSEAAIPLGASLPLGYVKRWNKQYISKAAASEYSSVLVRVKNKSQVGPVSAWVKKELGLSVKDSLGEKFAWVIFIVTSLFLLVSVVILLISASNIAHSFFVQVAERSSEIGLLRAVGARQKDVRRLLLVEAALLGLSAGLVGVCAGVLGGFFVDGLAASFLPDFPFRPDSYFSFEIPILFFAAFLAVFSCVMGGALPARRASKRAPAQSLAR